MQWLLDLFLLFFPSNCLVCGSRLPVYRGVLCFPCETQMPKYEWTSPEENPVSTLFWGRVPIQAGISLFRLEKGSVYQDLIHDLKYRGNRSVGLYLGRLLGLSLKQSVFASCDLMIPVPLHRKKLQKRGYNQSEVIARGVSAITGIPVMTRLLRRTGNQRSQTIMSRQERFENIASAFTLCKNIPDLQNKKILIIDDVVTTGATLEACSQVLLDRFDCRIYVATLSFA